MATQTLYNSSHSVFRRLVFLFVWGSCHERARGGVERKGLLCARTLPIGRYMRLLGVLHCNGMRVHGGDGGAVVRTAPSPSPRLHPRPLRDCRRPRMLRGELDCCSLCPMLDRSGLHRAAHSCPRLTRETGGGGLFPRKPSTDAVGIAFRSSPTRLPCGLLGQRGRFVSKRLSSSGSH